MAMTIPFLDLVKRAKEKFEGRHRPTGPAPLPSVENKPESDKLAKRVMPYAVRTMTPEPTAPALAAASAKGITRFASLSLSGLDRKSTRLNSSHARSSYAAVCVKKK